MSENFRTLVVVNPKGAGGAVGKRWAQIARTIADHFGTFEHELTKGPDDAARITRTALREGYEMIVALGGDGTISEVVNGFYDEQGSRVGDACLGILPYGTGGDFRKTAGISKELSHSARALRGKATREIDVGRLELTRAGGGKDTRYFLNIASFGIGGVVDELVNASSKTLGGRATFLLATLRAQFTYKNKRVRMVLDGGEPFEVTMNNVAVANGRYFGGGMQIAPRAEIDDGLFDVITLGDFTAGEMLLHGLKIYSGSHLSLPKVRMDRARVVEAFPVEASDQVLLDVDGETPGALPATFTCLPRSLRLKVSA